MDNLTDRLRGKYKIGEDGEFGERQFEAPPIALEAADRIEKLETMLKAKLELIRCGIGANYDGDPYKNEKYTEVTDLLSCHQN